MRQSTTNGLIRLPAIIEQSEAQAICNSLRGIWINTYETLPSELDTDLEKCRRYFDPVAQGQRLRRELSVLRKVPVTMPDPGPPLTLAIDSDRRIVTPEGRCALDLLENLPRAQSTHVISDLDLLKYDRRLAALYRDWSRHRIQSVIELLAGSNKPLQIPAAGVVIALLVNRCTSPQRALTRFAAGQGRDVVDRAFFTPVQSFSDILAPSDRRNRSDPKLVSGWMLYEARRRLGDRLIVVDARAGADGKVWIKSEEEDQVVEVVARDLARGHRSRVTPEKFGVAYDALVARLRQNLPSLAAFGMVHERPIHTRRLRDRFVTSLNLYLSDAT